jgi:capsular polysaccharide biosynthesis protein
VTIWKGNEQAPVSIDGPETLPEPLAAKRGTYHPEQPFVSELRDARLVGPHALGIVDDGRVVLETTSASRMYLNFVLSDLYDRLAADRSRFSAYRRYRRVIHGTEPVPPAESSGETPDQLQTAVAFVPYWRNYYHWTVEFLPKVRLLELYRDATDREPTLLLPADPPPWMAETLRLTGWDPDRCLECPETEVRVDRLVVPSHRNQYISPHDSRFRDDFNPAPDDVRWLASRMQSNVEPYAGEGFSSRVFLSRKDTKFRPVDNEDAIVEALRPRGFEPYVLTSLSLADQIRLFAQADVIVSPHGAGLVNMIHATDATVLELFPENAVKAYYFCLARQLGFEYHWRRYPTDGDTMLVDTEDLHRTVGRILGE